MPLRFLGATLRIGVAVKPFDQLVGLVSGTD